VRDIADGSASLLSITKAALTVHTHTHIHTQTHTHTHGGARMPKKAHSSFGCSYRALFWNRYQVKVLTLPSVVKSLCLLNLNVPIT